MNTNARTHTRARTQTLNVVSLHPKRRRGGQRVGEGHKRAVALAQAAAPQVLQEEEEKGGGRERLASNPASAPKPFNLCDCVLHWQCDPHVVGGNTMHMFWHV